MGEPLRHARYRPAEVLGSGAQGTVVRVIDRENPSLRLVAKIMRGARAGDGAIAGEFALLARSRIPGLARAHDLAEDEATGAPFLVEDFVDGPDAREHLASIPDGAARNVALVRVLADVARTLGALHDAGFVHGDLKPEHVRVPRGGRAMLLDLGAAVARRRDARASALTRGYAAPEVLADGAVTPAADLFGLGALAWSAATGSAPPKVRGDVRALAGWIAPSVADVIAALLAEHPRDRPEDARAVLARLGQSAAVGAWEAGPGAPIGRERELRELAGEGARVSYVVGPPGAGKSHLARELVADALLAGRAARAIEFPVGDARIVARLAAFFRGADDALPFALPDGAPLLVVLDGLDAAPAELASALEAFRCRGAASRVRVVATARTAPDGAAAVALGPLDERAFADLGRSVGAADPEIPGLFAQSGGLPGWLVASRGRVPLTRDAAIERARTLSALARDALTAIALAGGDAPDALIERLLGEHSGGAIAELLATSLVSRRRDARGARYALASPNLAPDVAGALADYELTDRVADAALATASSAAALLAIANAPNPPSRRAELLTACAARARSDGLRSEEVDALLGLAADPHARDGALLVRLERLTRDLGTAQAHPQVLEWLDVAGRADPRVRPLALRRLAEARARAGRGDEASELAASARDAARANGDAAAEAFALATAGAVALYRADWTAAERALGEGRALAIAYAADDPEEMARLDHNLGVVLLYRARYADAARALERSLAIKRTLGDKAGCRACLLNVALAYTRAERWDDAERALDEAMLLARSLGQVAGRGWCLAARADLDVRRGRPRDAERWTAEAEALGDALPAAVRADLPILRAEIAVAEGDGAAALRALGALDPAARQTDALTDARALVLEARAHLAVLPADPRRAARTAVAALRRARGAGLPEQESAATQVLRTARARARMRYVPRAMPAPLPDARETLDAPLWAWLADLGAGASADTAATSLAAAIVASARAERAFVVLTDDAAITIAAWGADLDGLPIGDAVQRVAADLIASALRSADPVYQRDLETPAGTGSRLAIASARGDGARAVVVVEHRFAPGRFDAIDGERVRRWATVASLLARVREPSLARASATTSSRASEVRPSGDSTQLPLREARRAFPTILGESPPLRRALARLDAAIDSDLPVLLTGETGVGKEVFARALHDLGPRARGPFVAVNCAAIPDALFEAELFGHARGAFTGADRARPGLLARADGGTLLLDEVGELPPLRQAALLRALESRRYRPVGSDDEIAFDARIVAATNVDLEQAVASGDFRQDLLFRLQVLEVKVPPLRERAEDVGVLAASFLARAGSSATLSSAALAALAAYAWPGNVRELEHQMQRLATAGLARIEQSHLPREIRAAAGARVASPLRAASAAPPREDAERDEVARALAATAGNITHAATRLGLTRHGLKKRMLRLGMRAPRALGKT